MKIAIASGKGGTGKTTVAANLAWVAAQAGADAAYVDCDVEEPNGHLFLKPVIETGQAVTRLVPRVDAQHCALCGECGRFCQFHAIVCLGPRVVVYPELCHGCGGCRLVCPQNAIGEEKQEIGRVAVGQAGRLRFVQGRLRVGEAQSPPVIRATKAAVPPVEQVLLDAPPGNSCPVVETARGSDLVLLVCEPTPFGLHDLEAALEVSKRLKLGCGVVINRALVGHPQARELCRQRRIPVLAEIPDNMAVAEACSEGRLAIEAVPGLRKTFAQMWLRLCAATGTQDLPAAVQRNLEEWAGPAVGPPGRTSTASSAPVCYLAFRHQKSNPAHHSFGASPSK